MNKIILDESRGFYEDSLIEKFNKNLEIMNNSSTLDERSKEAWNENKDISILLEIFDTLNEDIFFEMANFQKKDSGLKHNIWLDDMGKDRKNKHYGMRLKVEDPKDPKNLVPVSISMEPKILAGEFKNKKENISDVFEFIKLAYTDLVDHWNKKISSLDFMIKYKIN